MAAVVLFAGAEAARAAGGIDIDVQQVDGKPLQGAAVTLRRRNTPGGNAAVATPPGGWVMDQIGRSFAPELLVIPAGSTVLFPNSDTVSHQVYSFSPARRFELPLYRRNTQPTVRFESPGLITLGCNIHDNMIGWILVTDANWFGLTDNAGHWSASGLPPGEYEVAVWHPRMRDDPAHLTQAIRLTAGENTQLKLKANKPMRPPPLNGKSREWDY